jgi:hypothetical protein
VSDLKNLFELALADDADGTTVHGEVATDPSADLARGKRLLARRRHRRMLGGAAIGAVAAVTVAAVAVAPNAGGGKPSLANTASGAGRHPAATIRLVAYTGAQPPGYTVAVIPAGWVVQGSTPYALVIAPANAPNKDPDVFIGKLFVGQESFDPSGASAQGWSPAHIPGHTAYYSVQNAGGTQTASLVIEVTATDWLVIQAPTSLGWTEQQMIQFGLGVKILSTAQEGKG